MQSCRKCCATAYWQCAISGIKWAVPCENVSSGICGQRRSKSACASAQSDQGLPCPLPESLDTTECMNGKQRPEWYFARAQVDLNRHLEHARRQFFAWRGPNIYSTLFLTWRCHSEEVLANCHDDIGCIKYKNFRKPKKNLRDIPSAKNGPVQSVAVEKSTTLGINELNSEAFTLLKWNIINLKSEKKSNISFFFFFFRNSVYCWKCIGQTHLS